MTVVISLVVIVLVAALVGRTCARSKPGSHLRSTATTSGTTIDVTDPGPPRVRARRAGQDVAGGDERS